ncbi:MAG TPA: hypothetical protein VIM62_12170 [Acidobacteriaceae bacterium]
MAKQQSSSQSESRRCTVTLADGSRHTFDYGAMNIDKVVSAIQAV